MPEPIPDRALAPAPAPKTAVPKFEMLSGPADFANFGAGARGRADTLMSVRVRPNGGAAIRLGFATGKAIGNAVLRNRTRRRLRAVLAALNPRMAPGYDILFVLRPAGGAASSSELAASAERILRGLGVLRS